MSYIPYQLVFNNKFTSIDFNTSWYNGPGTQMMLRYTVTSFDLKDYYSNLLTPNLKFSSTDLYPLAVRYADEKKDVYVIERPPFKVSLDFSSKPSHKSRTIPSFLKDKEIWVPWTVSIINFDRRTNRYDFDIYFNDKPLESLDDYVVPCLLPNASQGRICMGDNPLPIEDIYNKDTNQLSVVNLYNFLFNSYFMGNWNSDLHPQMPNLNYFKDKVEQIILSNKKVPAGFGDLDEWNYSTNASYLTKSLFLLSHLSLEELLDYIANVKELSSKGAFYNGKVPIFQKRLSSYTNHLKNLQETSYDNSSAHHLYENYNNILSSLVSKEKVKHGVFTLTLLNCDIDVDNYRKSLHKYIAQNPFVLSQVYKHFHDSDTFEYNNLFVGPSIYLELDYKDVSHYFSIGVQNANSN